MIRSLIFRHTYRTAFRKSNVDFGCAWLKLNVSILQLGYNISNNAVRDYKEGN